MTNWDFYFWKGEGVGGLRDKKKERKVERYSIQSDLTNFKTFRGEVRERKGENCKMQKERVRKRERVSVCVCV